MLINAEEARAATNKINSEYMESILEESIKEAIAKGHFYCYITFGDTYAILDAIAILKKGAINTIKLPMICFVIKLNGKELIFMSVYACSDLKKIFMGKNKLLFYYFFCIY